MSEAPPAPPQPAAEPEVSPEPAQEPAAPIPEAVEPLTDNGEGAQDAMRQVEKDLNPRPKKKRVTKIMKEKRQIKAAKAGDARAAKLSPERRKEIAQLAAKKRWGKP